MENSNVSLLEEIKIITKNGSPDKTNNTYIKVVERKPIINGLYGKGQETESGKCPGVQNLHR